MRIIPGDQPPLLPSPPASLMRSERRDIACSIELSPCYVGGGVEITLRSLRRIAQVCGTMRDNRKKQLSHGLNHLL
jgi:hypothetical protein